MKTLRSIYASVACFLRRRSAQLCGCAVAGLLLFPGGARVAVAQEANPDAAEHATGNKHGGGGGGGDHLHEKKHKPAKGAEDPWWDLNGSTAGAGTNPSGIWDTTTSNWSSNLAGITTTGVWVNGSGPANFSAGSDATGSYTVTVSGAVNTTSMILQEGIITFAGTATPSLTISSIGGLTIDNTINGTTTFDSSLGNVLLSASQNWANNSSQAFNVNSGVVASGGPVTLTLNGTGSGGTNFSGVLGNGTGTLSLNVNTPGIINTFSGASTFTGGTTINGGTVLIGTSNVGTTSGALGPSTASVLLGATSGSSNASLLTNGAFTFSNAVTVQTGNTGIMTLGGSTADASIFSGNILLGTSGAVPSKNATFVAAGGGSVDFQGVISENTGNTTAANVTIGDATDSGTVRFSNAANTYSGTTTITNGATLEVTKLAAGGSNSSIGNSSSAAANLVLDGGTLKYTGSGDTSSRPFTVTANGGAIDSSGSGALSLTASGAGSIISSGTGNRTLTLTGSNTGANSLTGVVVNPSSGTTSLAKSGAGTWTLSGVNTYSGLTTISNGTLAEGVSNAIGSGDVTVNGAAAILAMGSNHSDTVGIVTVDGGGSITGTGTSTLISTGSFEMKSGSVGAILAGSGIALNKTTAGTVTLSGANIYTGGTFINGGTLSISSDGNLGNSGSGLTIANGATLGVTASVVSGRTVTLNAGGATFDLAAPLQLTGLITGGTGITTGGNDLILNRASGNNAIGAITVDSGRLFAFTINSINGSSIAVNPGAILDFSVTGGATPANTMTFASGAGVANRVGTLTLSTATAALPTAGTMVFNNDDSATTAITVNGNYPALTGDLTIQVGGMNATVGTVTLNGVISGSHGLTKTSTGTLTLSGANTYTGLTDVQAGTLALGASNVFANASTIKVSGGILSLANNSDTVAGVQLTGGSITGTTGVLTSTTAFDLQAGSVTGILGGSVGATKTTAGTVNLSGANTYTGATVIDGGTLTLSGASGAIASSTGITIGEGATIQLDNTTINLNRIGTVTVTMNGGTFDFAHATNNSTYSETAGTLSINSGASTISTDVASSSGSSILTFGALSRTAGATVNFGDGSGNPSSGSDNNNVRFTAQAAGLIGAWATVGGTSFANYNTASSTDSVEALASYGQTITRLSSGTKIIANTPANNIQVTDGSGSAANITLAAATTTINTLTNSATGGTSTINPAGQTLQVGGILNASGSGALTIGNGTNNGTLTSNVAGGELVLDNYSTNALTVNSVIANNTSATALTKSGSGTLILTGANTYTGATFINAGTLNANATSGKALGGTSNIIVNSGGTLLTTTAQQFNATTPPTMTLAGGTFNTNGTSQTLGALTLSNTSIINLATGTSDVLLAASNAATWASNITLSIQNWSGSQSGGGTDQLIFGTDSSGLTAAQIAEVQFLNPDGFSAGTYGAMILSTGEIVPIPEPSTWIAGVLAFATLLYTQRRSRTRR